MKGENKRRHPFGALLLCMGALFALGVTGCQVDVGGQTLPSPYYLTDDVQYFPTGPKMKLQQEADHMKASNPNPAYPSPSPTPYYCLENAGTESDANCLSELRHLGRARRIARGRVERPLHCTARGCGMRGQRA